MLRIPYPFSSILVRTETKVDKWWHQSLSPDHKFIDSPFPVLVLSSFLWVKTPFQRSFNGLYKRTWFLLNKVKRIDGDKHFKQISNKIELSLLGDFQRNYAAYSPVAVSITLCQCNIYYFRFSSMNLNLNSVFNEQFFVVEK